MRAWMGRWRGGLGRWAEGIWGPGVGCGEPCGGRNPWGPPHLPHILFLFLPPPPFFFLLWPLLFFTSRAPHIPLPCTFISPVLLHLLPTFLLLTPVFLFAPICLLYAPLPPRASRLPHTLLLLLTSNARAPPPPCGPPPFSSSFSSSHLPLPHAPSRFPHVPPLTPSSLCPPPPSSLHCTFLLLVGLHLSPTFLLSPSLSRLCSSLSPSSCPSSSSHPFLVPPIPHTFFLLVPLLFFLAPFSFSCLSPPCGPSSASHLSSSYAPPLLLCTFLLLVALHLLPTFLPFLAPSSSSPPVVPPRP